MRKFFITAITFMASFSIISCNESSTTSIQNGDEAKKQQGVLVNLSTTNGTGENSITKDSSYLIQSDYFEIGLYSVAHGKSHIAEKEIEEPTSIENFKSVTLYVVDSTLKPIHFSNSTDFLNFMSERGYEMQDQQKENQHIDYTFKKK